MQLNEPNDLLHLFFKYGVSQVPISKNGDITGKLVKSDIVRHLSRSENFEKNIVTTIENLLEPADESFFSSMKKKLKEGMIDGIPIIREKGEVKQVVTPGVLDAQDEANEFFDESEKREIYESFLRDLPFPVKLTKNGDTFFQNQACDKKESQNNWETLAFERDELTLKMMLPDIVKELMDCFNTVKSGGEIDIRELLDALETRLMEEAHNQSESISEASNRLGLPRQTFNYRWSQKDSGPVDDSSAAVNRSN